MSTANDPWGRVDDSGTVFVRTAEGEREVGSWQAGSPEEALDFFKRKYSALETEVTLLEQRFTTTDLSPAQAQSTIERLLASVKDARAVGDLDGLQCIVEAGGGWRLHEVLLTAIAMGGGAARLTEPGCLHQPPVLATQNARALHRSIGRSARAGDPIPAVAWQSRCAPSRASDTVCQAAGVPRGCLMIDDAATLGAAPFGAEHLAIVDLLEVVWPGALLQHLEVGPDFRQHLPERISAGSPAHHTPCAWRSCRRPQPSRSGQRR